MNYKVLSVRQPFATLLVSGIKDVENRGKKTNFRGTVLIHASATMHDRVAELKGVPGFKLSPVDRKILATSEVVALYPYAQMSAIIGSVDIVDCVQDSKSDWAEEGSWHWVCANAKLFEKPITGVKGKLGLWDWEGSIPDLEEHV